MCIDMDHMVKSVADSRLMLFDLGNEMLYAFCNQVLNQRHTDLGSFTGCLKKYKEKIQMQLFHLIDGVTHRRIFWHSTFL